MIGAITSPGASHTGAPTAGDTNAITAPWSLFGSTGSDYTTVGITGDTVNGLNMSGWTGTWNGILAIPMGSGSWTPAAAIAGMAAGPLTLMRWASSAGMVFLAALTPWTTLLLSRWESLPGLVV